MSEVYWYVDVCKICIRFSDIKCLFGESYKYPCLINNEGQIQKGDTETEKVLIEKKKRCLILMAWKEAERENYEITR